MTKPLVMEIPHDLGHDEARKRLVEGSDKLKPMLGQYGVAVDTMAWNGDRLDFAVSALSQRMEGQIDVRPDTVRVEVRLPLLLALFADKIQKMVGKEGALLLTKK